MEWIKVSEKLPKHGLTVLATYKNSYDKNRIIIAVHLDRFREESTYDDCDDEYSEELDNYFLKEGWYEQIDNWGDFSFVTVCEGIVSHWMPLPVVP